MFRSCSLSWNLLVLHPGGASIPLVTGGKFDPSNPPFIVTKAIVRLGKVKFTVEIRR